MGKVKAKSHDEVEYLKGVIREQRTEILQLKRELKALRIAKFRLQELEEIIEFAPTETAKYKKCTHCGKGEVEPKALPFGQLLICNVCKKTEVIKTKDNDAN